MPKYGMFIIESGGTKSFEGFVNTSNIDKAHEEAQERIECQCDADCDDCDQDPFNCNSNCDIECSCEGWAVPVADDVTCYKWGSDRFLTDAEVISEEINALESKIEYQNKKRAQAQRDIISLQLDMRESERVIAATVSKLKSLR